MILGPGAGSRDFESSPMHYTEKEAFLALLVEVARADRRIAPEERALIHTHLSNLSQEVGAADIVSRLDDPAAGASDPRLADIATALGRHALPAAVRDAFVLAAADGEISREELAVLRQFLIQAGVPAENFPLVIRWCESALDHLRQARYIFGLE